MPILCSGSAKASDNESTEEALEFSLQYAKSKEMCKPGDSVVALHCTCCRFMIFFIILLGCLTKSIIKL